MEATEIRGEVDRISFRNEESGWTVLRLKSDAHFEMVTVTGSFATIRPGEHYQLLGHWTNHQSYGRQFKVERSVAIRPNSSRSIKKYLASGLIPGIGEKTADKIVSHFGENTFDILDKKPERLQEVPSIGRKKAEAIIDAWQINQTNREIDLFLSTHGLSPSLAAKIIRNYGNAAISVVSRNPYRLAVDISGIGFLTADKIAQSIGIALDSPERVNAAILYILEQAEERGHTYLTTAQIHKELAAILGLAPEQILDLMAPCLIELNRGGALISETITTEDGLTSAHFLTELLTAEATIAAHLANLLQTPMTSELSRINDWLSRYSQQTGSPLTDSQLSAVRQAATHRVFILTGGPGVGKTTTANAIIRLLKAMGKTVALAAPTGRAAQRLTEVSAMQAKTIHRLLEWTPQNHGFTKDEFNPLTAQAVVIDEASMLDARLAANLLSAIPRTSQIIFIGDVDQLPSVGPGNVLHDMIDSQKVPFCRLTEIFRQASSSAIIQTAHAINRGEVPQFSNEAGVDCRFIEAENPEDIKGIVQKLMKETLPQKLGFHPIRDIQILTPMNRGDIGTKQLNDEIQQLLNPPRPDVHEFKRESYTLRRGDKVIQSSNNYDLNVFNGDIGYVEEAAVDGGKVIVTFGDERTVTYTPDNVGDLRLAYAITIHKSQGSEFPVVILPISMQHYVMLQRNLVYTGLTRARKLAIFVGSRRALQYAVQNQISMKRQTFLVERIHRELQHA